MKVYKKSKLLISVILFFVVLSLSVVGAKMLYEKWQESNIDANALFFSALDDIQQWQSYRYTLETTLQLDNYKTAKTVLNGESDINGNLHMFGKIMDSEMEAYQFGNDHYRYRSAAKKWVHLENSPLTDNGILLMSVDPIRNFDFTDTISVTYKEKIKTDGKKYYRFIVVPKEGFHVADTYFTDFKYVVHIDTETKRIAEATIGAVSRTESQNKLTVRLCFYDINDQFTLTPPEV